MSATKQHGPPPEKERPANVGTKAERNLESQCKVFSNALAARIKRVDARAPLNCIVEVAFAGGRWDDRGSKALCFLAGHIVVNTVNNRWTNVANGHSGSGTISLFAEAFGLELVKAASVVEALIYTLTDDDGEIDWPSFLKEAA